MRPKLRSLARRKSRSLVLLGAATAAVVLGLGASAQAAPFVYVTNASSDNVLQYDVGAGGLLSPLSPATVAAGDGAGAVAVSPDGQSAYVTNGGDSTVSQYSVGADGVLSPKSPAIVAAGSNGSNISGPHGLAITPDGQSVYVADHGYFRGGGGLLQYSVGADGALTSPTVARECCNPAKVAVSPDGQSVYVTSPESGSILQYDVGPGGGLSLKYPAYVAAGVYPAAVAVSPDGQSVYAADTGEYPLGGSEPAAIIQYDVGAGGKLWPKSPAEVSAGDSPWGVAVSPDGQSVYVTNSSPGTVSQYDVGPGGELSPKSPATVAAAGAFGVAVDQDGESVYVTNGSSVFQYDVGAGGRLSPKSPPTVAAAGGFGVAVSPPLNHPQTDITGGPTMTSDPTPTFTFSSSEPGSSFECKLDSGAYSDCGSPKTTAQLTDGRHTFYVRATDSAENVDPTPARRTFTVDTVPPQTTITSGPSGMTDDPTPTFGFSSSEGGSSFECRLDSGSFTPCSSPMTTAHLTDGAHTFHVRASDRAANADPTPAIRTFTVRTTAVRVSGSTLVVTAGPAAENHLVIVSPFSEITNLRVTGGSALHAGAGCHSLDDGTVDCNATTVTLIKVSAGDRADSVVNSTAYCHYRLPPYPPRCFPARASSINGGPGNDRLIGGSAGDTLTGGPGADVLKGMNGPDLLQAHDLASDKTINCDGGTKPGSADKADLDRLPKDPDSKVFGCEFKTRH